MARDQNENLLDQFNNQIGRLKTARFAATALSSGFWWWIILGTIFSISFITLTMDLGNEGAASEGNQTGSNQAAQITNFPPSPGCPDGNYASCLSKNFNIQLDDSFLQQQNSLSFEKQFFDSFSIAYDQSSFYRTLWNNGNRKLILKYGKPPIWGERPISTCTGQAETAGDYGRTYDVMYLWNMDACSLSTGNAYLIIHETGHILADRNIDNVFNIFPYQTLAQEDPQCYKSNGFLKTYIGEGPYVQAEDFAESTEEYVLYKSWNTGAGLSDFPNTCRNTYMWLQQHVFGGVVVAPTGP